MKRVVAAALVLIWLPGGAALAQPAATAPAAAPPVAMTPLAAEASGAGFTPAQRAEIVDILRNALKTDPSILRDAVAALQADEGVRQEAATRAAIADAGPALTATPGDPFAGNPEGRRTLVEFYDVRCPYCRRMLPVEAELVRRDPDVKVIFKDIPILGPGSVIGARAVLAAQRQGGYDRLRVALMSGPADITDDTVRQAADRLGLDWTRLQRDMADPAIATRIDANIALAKRLEIQGTPAYVVNGRMIAGAVELSDLESALGERTAKP